MNHTWYHDNESLSCKILFQFVDDVVLLSESELNLLVITFSIGLEKLVFGNRNLDGLVLGQLGKSLLVLTTVKLESSSWDVLACGILGVVDFLPKN